METTDLTFQVLVDPAHPPLVEGAVSFELGPADRPKLAYNHGPEDPGALTTFFEDLVSGVPMPLTLAIRSVGGLDTILAVALFLHRELAIHPAMPGLVAAVDLIHRKGPPFYGHVEADLGRFLRGVSGFFPEGLSKEVRGERIGTAAQWVRAYLMEGTLPNIGPQPPRGRILDIGTNGFVLADAEKASEEGWDDLYRKGFLRGVLLGPPDGDFRTVVASKKGPQVEFDLNKAAMILNEVEALSGGEPGWEVKGLYLFSPPIGTTVQVSYLMEVFLRV